jgi:regulator of sirC expression with transglutaminase-like and TPR domain
VTGWLDPDAGYAEREGILEAFGQAVSGRASEVPLARAALLVAKAEQPSLDVDAYERRLQDIAQTLSQQLGRTEAPLSAKRAVQTVNQLLFRELGFRGNAAHYDDPRNLRLDWVLDERRGIPVTLAIVYAEVCQRSGLDVYPVGLPGHVICRYAPFRDRPRDDGELYIDVFNGGQLVSEEDCEEIVRRTFGGRAPFKPHYLDSLTPRQVIQRLLHNLKAGYLQRGEEERAERIIDLLLAMFPWDLDELRDRGMLRERLGDVEPALRDLEQYVRYRAGARDIQTVSETVRSLRRHAGAPDEDG